MSGPGQSYNLTNTSAPLFATFGCKDPRYYLSLKMKNQNILALIDSGSTKTYVNDKAANLLGNFQESSAVMTAANNNTVELDGEK